MLKIVNYFGPNLNTTTSYFPIGTHTWVYPNMVKTEIADRHRQTQKP